jgi:thioredoxin 1
VSIFFRFPPPILPMADIAALPGLLIANGKARYGTKVQIVRDGAWLKGTAVGLDYEKQLVQITFETGRTSQYAAADVHRQFPHAPTSAPAAPLAPEMRRAQSFAAGALGGHSGTHHPLASGHGTELRRASSVSFGHTFASGTSLTFPSSIPATAPTTAAAAPAHDGPGYLATKAEFDLCILTNATVIVDYTATWCGPCKNIAPKFAELARLYPSVVFKKVDVDDNAETSQAAGISAMPTFIVYKKGQVRDQMSGATAAKLEEFVRKHAAN